MPISRKGSRVKGLPPEATGRAANEYMAVLDDEAFGAATDVVPKFVSPADPERDGPEPMADKHSSPSHHYLIDVDNGIIVDVEETTAIQQAEVLAAKRMIERSLDRFDFTGTPPGDSAYGSAEMLGGCRRAWHRTTCTVFGKSTRQATAMNGHRRTELGSADLEP